MSASSLGLGCLQGKICSSTFLCFGEMGLAGALVLGILNVLFGAMIITLGS